VATWETLPGLLRSIFETSTSRSPRVPLSNVKRVFRSQLQVELSETALGHSKLSELFQDARLAGVCAISHTSIGYVVVPLAGFRRGAAAAPETGGRRGRARCVASLDMALIEPSDASTADEESSSPAPLGDTTGCVATPSPRGAVGGMPLPTLLRSLHKTPSRCACAAIRQEADDGAKAPSKRRELQPQQLSVWNTFIHFALPPPTPMGTQMRPRAQSLPRIG